MYFVSPTRLYVVLIYIINFTTFKNDPTLMKLSSTMSRRSATFPILPQILA